MCVASTLSSSENKYYDSIRGRPRRQTRNNVQPRRSPENLYGFVQGWSFESFQGGSLEFRAVERLKTKFVYRNEVNIEESDSRAGMNLLLPNIYPCPTRCKPLANQRSACRPIRVALASPKMPQYGYVDLTSRFATIVWWKHYRHTSQQSTMALSGSREKDKSA